MEYTNVLKSIGLAARARKITFGSELTSEGIRAGQVVLVLICREASEGTSRRIVRTCQESGTEYHVLSCDGVSLAHALGKNKPLAVIGITDENMCVPIRKNILALSEQNASLMTFSESEV